MGKEKKQKRPPAEHNNQKLLHGNFIVIFSQRKGTYCSDWLPVREGRKGVKKRVEDSREFKGSDIWLRGTVKGSSKENRFVQMAVKRKQFFAVMGHKFTHLLTKEVTEVSNIRTKSMAVNPQLALGPHCLKCHWKNGF